MLAALLCVPPASTNTSGASGANNDGSDDDGMGNRRRTDGGTGNSRSDGDSTDDSRTKLRLERCCRLRLRRQLLTSQQL